MSTLTATTDERPCEVCRHDHFSTKAHEIETAGARGKRGKTIILHTCAPCTLLLAGVKPYGCLEDYT